MNVEYQSYPGPGGEGFVVCLIPESNHKPHRAEFADRQYYYRAGDDFLPAEPGLLRILFYPQITPRLSTEVELTYKIHPSELFRDYQLHRHAMFWEELVRRGSAALKIMVRLSNDGTATAKHTLVVAQSNLTLTFSPAAGWQAHNHPQGQRSFQADRPIHPGEVVDLFSATITPPYQGGFRIKAIETPDGLTVIPDFGNIQINFIFYAEGSTRQDATVVFTPDDFKLEILSATKNSVPS